MAEHHDDARGNREASILPFPTMPRSEPASDHPDDLRAVIGNVLRTERQRQERTLAQVAADAAVSLAYLSEIERGRKDVSSEILIAVTGALELPLATVLERCARQLDTRAKGNVLFQLCAA